MSDARLVWALFAPLLGGALALLLVQPFRGRPRSRNAVRWIDALALGAACGGLFAQAILVLLAEGSAAMGALSTQLVISPVARLEVIAADVALACVLFVSWQAAAPRSSNVAQVSPTIAVAGLAASLLGGALLVDDQVMSAIMLLGSALLVAAFAAIPLPSRSLGSEDAAERGALAKRLAGGLKHLSLSVVGTGLLLVGTLLLARSPFNLENTGLLQAGFGLLWVGLAVRAGSMPFTGGPSDLVEAAPRSSILLLGACVPAVLAAGLIWLEPLVPRLTDVSPAGRQAALGLAAAGALLAGVRALAVRREQERARVDPLSLLIGASVALEVAWALFGIFAGSQSGRAGAALIAANLALAVPLLATTRRSGGVFAGAAALLGLPPFGGFVGTMLVARAAVDAGGWWLAALLLGTALVAAGWLEGRKYIVPRGAVSEEEGQFAPDAPLDLLSWVLVAANVGLLVISVPLAGIL